MKGGNMETEGVYVINTRLFGTARGTGRHSSGQFTSADLARWGLVSAAESHAYEAPQVRGDFICEIFRYPGRKPIMTFRMEKKQNLGVVAHQPDCPCEGCIMLMRMTEDLDFL